MLSWWKIIASLVANCVHFSAIVKMRWQNFYSVQAALLTAKCLSASLGFNSYDTQFNCFWMYLLLNVLAAWVTSDSASPSCARSYASSSLSSTFFVHPGRSSSSNSKSPLLIGTFAQHVYYKVPPEYVGFRLRFSSYYIKVIKKNSA